jgi:NAD(P)-dependent dehydrogenase (short-subunit alcohol dehydrogenase family)
MRLLSPPAHSRALAAAPPPRAAHPGCKVEVGPSLDLMSQDSVKKFATAIGQRAGPLNILVNNAG